MNIITEYAENKNVPIKCKLVGSMAKKTSLIDKADIDIFMAFPLSYSEEELKEYGLEFGKHCITLMNGKSELRFASHPYITGFIEGYEIDFVPCYTINDASELKSAVDRTILHTNYVQSHLSDEEASQVLLLKKFMTCVNTYGANYKVSGFSGYLCELLILKYHSFEEVLKAASYKWHKHYKIDLENYGTCNKFKDPLIAIDPVDKNRNVAAALSMQKFSEFIVASRNFLDNPNESYFQEKEIQTSKEYLLGEFEKRDTKCYVLSFEVPELPTDVIYPQVNKTMNSFVNVSKIYDFDVIENSYYIDANSIAHIIIEYEIDKLSNIKIHHGPQVKLYENGVNFLKKYPKAYVKDNKWIAVSNRKYSAVNEMLEGILRKENISILKLGKNIKEGISKNIEIEKVDEFLSKENKENYENIFMHLNPGYKLTR